MHRLCSWTADAVGCWSRLVVGVCSLFQKIGPDKSLVEYNCKMTTSVRTCAYYLHRFASSPCTNPRPPNPETCLVPGLHSTFLPSLGKPEAFSSRSLHTKKRFFFYGAPTKKSHTKTRVWSTKPRSLTARSRVYLGFHPDPGFSLGASVVCWVHIC